ncbi:hypothetical protein AAVH_21258 [Aphelenchoides avenae]|nr:hypothetical protein AAVH_21258 [Aphelenchus avenae]
MLSKVQIAGCAAEGFLLTFHVSVLVCILKERRKRTPAFLSGFFGIYCMQSVADVVDYAPTFVYVRLTNLGYVPQEALGSPQGPIAYFVLAYAIHFQFVAHVAIAFNRFFVLIEAWTDRKQGTILASALVLPLPAAAIRLIGGVKVVETVVSGIYAISRDIRWAGAAGQMIIAVSSVATSVVSFILELRSLAVYKQLTASAKQKYRNDFLLLINAPHYG